LSNNQKIGQIRIKEFGPIKSGYEANQGFIDISKITVFIGNQATGKSSIAKLISTFTWLEKSLFRGTLDEKEITRKNKFENNYCYYHRLNEYFRPETEIEFKGAYYTFQYRHGYLHITHTKDDSAYRVPKIMYVPAERNFLSAVDRPDKLKGIPQPLFTFLSEFDRSQQELTGDTDLPIGNLKFHYQKQNKTASIVGSDYKIKLLEASSGLQSSVPLFLVSKNLTESIRKEGDQSRKEISIEEEKRLKAEIRKIIANTNLTDDTRRAALEELSAQFKNSYFINIVEEIEQNLYPTSQKEMLFKLLEFANDTSRNALIMTTHSPYIVNYLTLAMKAFSVSERIHRSNAPTGLLNRLDTVVPRNSCIAPGEVTVYELKNGTITPLSKPHDVLSDNNYLNQSLDEANLNFDELLEIEEEIEGSI